MPLPIDYAARKRLALWTYLTEYFPDSFLAEVEVAIVGNDQHNPSEPLHWAREKSTDQMNTAARHMFDYSLGTKKDVDGCYHLAKAIWRLKAQLQLDIEADRKAGYAVAPKEISHGNQDQAEPQGFVAQELGCGRREANTGGQISRGS